MSTITQYFQPPLYWQQFEDLTVGVFSAVYGDPKPTKFGRSGQAQNGVDVYGYDGNNRLIAIQCKRMDERDENNDPRPGGAITPNILDREIKEAREGFKKSIDTWVMATTAKRDRAIQLYAVELSEKSRAAGSFGVQIWFWDDFITDLNRHHDLAKWYYEQVILILSSDDQDKLILEMLGEAFARAAFRVPINLEIPADFIQALKDTQHAINTGELKDRETRRVIRKTIGGRRAIASKSVGAQLRVADEKLQELRREFQQRLGQSAGGQPGGILQISPAMQRDLSAMRDEAVAAINAALVYVGLQPV